MQQAILLLDDGTKLEGQAAGVPGVTVGDLSVYTAHDYVHRMTDPIAAGQICAFTMPVVGTWGVNTENCETGKPWIRGIIARNMENNPSCWRSAETLDYYLRRNLISAITDIDTEALYETVSARNIRKCAIVSSPGFNGWDALLNQVKSYRFDSTFPAAVKAAENYGPQSSLFAHVAVCDFGASQGLCRLLASMRIRTTLLPPYDAATIVSRGGFDGLILPPGSGSPRNHPGITEALRDLLHSGLPVLGMGLGCGFIAAAAGARFARMPSPHRGEWHPVTDLERSMTIYTRQYHEYDFTEGLPDSLRVTHRNATDGSVEGFHMEGYPVTAVQFHPCSDPRIGGTGMFLGQFLSNIQAREGKGA